MGTANEAIEIMWKRKLTNKQKLRFERQNCMTSNQNIRLRLFLGYGPMGGLARNRGAIKTVTDRIKITYQNQTA